MHGNPVLLEESKASINECGNLLKEISTTCCMPDRSINMSEAFTSLENILVELDLSYIKKENIHNAINQIGNLGSLVGYLYSTCCTTSREPLYQKMYKEMSSAHGKLWQYLGHSH